MMKKKTAVALLGGTLLLTAGQAWSDDFPSRPLTLVNPYAAGGPADNVARVLAKELGAVLKQQVVVENKAGAGATIGAAHVAKATPDGYTLLFGTAASHVVSPLMQPTPYDGIKDFEFVALAANQPNLLVVHPSLNVKTVDEFVALAKKPDQNMNYGSSGSGTSPHIGGELIKQAKGIDLGHIPYKGAAPAITDLVAGRTQMGVMNLSGELPFVKAGKLVALAYASKKRSPLLPEVPTFEEAGLGGAESASWYTVAAPKGTPKAVVDKLNAAINEVMNNPEYRRTMESQGTELETLTPDQTLAFVQEDARKLNALMKHVPLKMD